MKNKIKLFILLLIFICSFNIVYGLDYVLYDNGFEDGGATPNANWSTTGGSPTLSTTYAHSGSYSLKLDANGERTRTTNLDDYVGASDDFVVEFWLYVTGITNPSIRIDGFNGASESSYFTTNEGSSGFWGYNDIVDGWARLGVANDDSGRGDPYNTWIRVRRHFDNSNTNMSARIGETLINDFKDADYPSIINQLQFYDSSSGQFYIDDIKIWDYATYGYDMIDETIPQTNNYNYTNNNIINESLRATWNNDTTNLIIINSINFSMTFNTNINSNCSAVVDNEFNYSTAITNNSEYKLLTTDTTNHSITALNDSFSEGNHYLCLACISENGFENISCDVKLNFSLILPTGDTNESINATTYSLSSANCPNTLPNMFLLVALLFLGGFLIVIGFKHSIFGILGGIFWIVLALIISGCSPLIGYSIILISTLMVIFFAIK